MLSLSVRLFSFPKSVLMSPYGVFLSYLSWFVLSFDLYFALDLYFAFDLYFPFGLNFVLLLFPGFLGFCFFAFASLVLLPFYAFIKDFMGFGYQLYLIKDCFFFLTCWIVFLAFWPFCLNSDRRTKKWL